MDDSPHDTATDDQLEILSEDRSWQLLGQKQFGRLAVAIQGKPDIFPVNYRVDEETIVVKTAAGLKLAAATLGTGVAFEVDAIDEVRHRGWTVVVLGTAVEIERLDELVEADRLLLDPWAGGKKSRYLRIHPEHISGRSL